MIFGVRSGGARGRATKLSFKVIAPTMDNPLPFSSEAPVPRTIAPFTKNVPFKAELVPAVNAPFIRKNTLFALAPPVSTIFEFVPVTNALFVFMINIPDPLNVSVPFKVVGDAVFWQETPGVIVWPANSAAIVLSQVAVLSELYAASTSLAACIASGDPGKRLFPIRVPGGKPVKAPALVPTSPVTVVLPLTVNAPSAVKKAKLDVDLKLGACVCPKLTFVNANTVATVEMSVKVFLMILSSV